MSAMRSVSAKRQELSASTSAVIAQDFATNEETSAVSTPRESSGAAKGERIQDIVAAHARKDPGRVAMNHGPFSLTYGVLNAAANRLARYLISTGLRPETPVGLCLSGGFVGMIGTLAVLKAGGACVPLDRRMGSAWIADFLAHAGIDLVMIEDREDLPLFRQSPRLTLLDYTALTEVAHTESDEDVELAWDNDSLAAIVPVSQIFGPRGVEWTHHTLSRAAVLGEAVGLSPEKTVLQMEAASHETTFFETLGILAAGARLVYYGAAWPDSAEIVNRIREEDVDTLFLTPSLCEWLVDEAPSLFTSLERVVITEQILSPEPVSRLHLRECLHHFPNGDIFLLYSPLEAPAVMVTRLDQGIDDVEAQTPEILPGARLLMLDSRQSPCPDGVVGEIHIGGSAIARAYRRDAMLTQHFFVPQRDSAGRADERVLRTGDFARHMPGGNLERLGRRDTRRNLRGRRIELTAVEAILQSQAGVADVLCDYRRNREYGEVLIAWIVEKNPGAVNEKRLLAELRRLLPSFMVPDLIHKMTAVPLLPDGMPDRMALAKMPMFPRKKKQTKPAASAMKWLFSAMHQLSHRNGCGKDLPF